MSAGTRPAQAPNRQNPSTWVKAEILTAAEELLALDNFWKRESVFFNNVTPDVMITCQVKLHPKLAEQHKLNSTNRKGKKGRRRNLKVEEEGMGGMERVVMGGVVGVYMFKIPCIEFSKN